MIRDYHEHDTHIKDIQNTSIGMLLLMQIFELLFFKCYSQTMKWSDANNLTWKINVAIFH